MAGNILRKAVLWLGIFWSRVPHLVLDWKFFSKKTAHISAARDAAERRKLERAPNLCSSVDLPETAGAGFCSTAGLSQARPDWEERAGGGGGGGGVVFVPAKKG